MNGCARLAFCLSVAALLGGCTHGQRDSSTTTPARPTGEESHIKAIALPNPSPSNLPVGARVLLQRSGVGPASLDLTQEVGTAEDVSIRWVCVGPGELKVERDSDVLAGGGCSSSASSATIDGATVPRKVAESFSWHIEADQSSQWRLIVTASG